jgi:outer membrane protein assembly factor BamD (BamD/ComL family)
VIYDDTVAVRYTDANGLKTDTHLVTISKGADGSIEPFSKIYQDQEVAMRTQFSMAEAYLELAKRHRLLGEHEAAALEYTTAKQLLSSAMEQFTDPETRAQAEYLLGNLTAEEADTTTDPALKETRYRAALSRFLNVTGSYPNTLHASKAQYRIAVIYEALKEPEIAAQEYVKLAYKYPESEFVATSMARLGTHFLKLAGAYEEKAKPLLAKGEAEGDQDALFEGQAMQKMAEAEYLKTASIFGRLQDRFPGSELAGQAGLRSGQAYMRARRDQDALDAFLKVVEEENYDGVKIRAQAMYWAGMCYQKLGQQMAAYAIFKRLTYDFPESEWAAFARAQLSQESMINLESNLELERLEGKQEK